MASSAKGVGLLPEMMFAAAAVRSIGKANGSWKAAMVDGVEKAGE